MEIKPQIAQWIASIETSDLGYVYVRLSADAPRAARNALITQFGKHAVFLPPQRPRSLAA